jgi:hypothetical protein
MTENAAAPPVSLFYSYAHEDEALCDELRGHLKILERRGLLASWYDREITPGEDWHAKIDAQLQMADLVLLLISKDFIDSDYIFGNELTVAMQRHKASFTSRRRRRCRRRRAAAACARRSRWPSHRRRWRPPLMWRAIRCCRSWSTASQRASTRRTCSAAVARSTPIRCARRRCV